MRRVGGGEWALEFHLVQVRCERSQTRVSSLGAWLQILVVLRVFVRVCRSHPVHGLLSPGPLLAQSDWLARYSTVEIEIRCLVYRLISVHLCDYVPSLVDFTLLP